MFVSAARNMIIIGLLVLAVTAVMLARSGRLPYQHRTAGSDAAEVTKASPEVPLPRLLDLGSDKCTPCRMMAPVLAELSRTYKGSFKVEVIDVNRNSAAAAKHMIRVIPTQIFYDASGRERFRHEGYMSREAILAKWKQLGVTVVARPSPIRVD